MNVKKQKKKRKKTERSTSEKSSIFSPSFLFIEDTYMAFIITALKSLNFFSLFLSVRTKTFDQSCMKYVTKQGTHLL